MHKQGGVRVRHGSTVIVPLTQLGGRAHVTTVGVVPTALRLVIAQRSPAVNGWANICRAYGATDVLLPLHHLARIRLHHHPHLLTYCQLQFLSCRGRDVHLELRAAIYPRDHHHIAPL